MKLIHCSFDIIDEFVPRVPDSRVKHDGKDMENSVTPRICTAPSILLCLRAIPKAGETIRWAQAVGMKPVIHAYYLQAPQNSIRKCTVKDVPDAEVTHEIWVLDKPLKVIRRDYEITTCAMHDQKDILGNDYVMIDNVRLKRVPNTDNLKTLINELGFEYEVFMDRFPFLTFREFAANIPYTERLREMREKVKNRKQDMQ